MGDASIPSASETEEKRFNDTNEIHELDSASSGEDFLSTLDKKHEKAATNSSGRTQTTTTLPPALKATKSDRTTKNTAVNTKNAAKSSATTKRVTAPAHTAKSQKPPAPGRHIPKEPRDDRFETDEPKEQNKITGDFDGMKTSRKVKGLPEKIQKRGAKQAETSEGRLARGQSSRPSYQALEGRGDSSEEEEMELQEKDQSKNLRQTMDKSRKDSTSTRRRDVHRELEADLNSSSSLQKPSANIRYPNVARRTSGAQSGKQPGPNRVSKQEERRTPAIQNSQRHIKPLAASSNADHAQQNVSAGAERGSGTTRRITPEESELGVIDKSSAADREMLLLGIEKTSEDPHHRSKLGKGKEEATVASERGTADTRPATSEDHAEEAMEAEQETEAEEEEDIEAMEDTSVSSLDDKANEMFGHILELASNPREWLDFLAEEDYSIARGQILLTDFGHSSAYDMLVYLFGKVNDNVGKKYEHTCFDFDSIRVRFGKEPEVYCSSKIWEAYTKLINDGNTFAQMTDEQKANWCNTLWKVIVDRTPYLLCNKDSKPRPSRNMSYVLLLVLTLVSKHDLGQHIKQDHALLGNHNLWYEDSVSELLRHLLHDKYPTESICHVAEIFRHLSQRIQEAQKTYSLAVEADSDSEFDLGASSIAAKSGTETSSIHGEELPRPRKRKLPSEAVRLGKQSKFCSDGLALDRER